MKKTLKKNSESGFALIAVLLIVAVLAAIILEFNYESRMKLHLTDNFHLASQALNNADAGIAIAISVLKQNEDILADKTLSPFFSGMVQLPIEDGFCTISVTEENGKININALATSDDQLMRYRVDQMLRLIDLINGQYGENSPISYNLIPAMIDWIDSDDDVILLPFIKGENRGAENDYYQKLQDPYPCKNAPFELLSELLLVKGVTMEIFEGRACDENTGKRTISGINQFLTVYGDGKININEASITVIQSLSDSMNFALAQNIIEQRKFSRYSNIEQLKQVPGMTAEIYEAIRELITVKPENRYYTVTGTGVAEQFERTVRVVLQKDTSTSQVDVVMRCEL